MNADLIINSALYAYCVEIVGTTGRWQRSFVYASDIATARFLARAEKERFVAPLSDKRAKTLVKRFRPRLGCDNGG